MIWTTALRNSPCEDIDRRKNAVELRLNADLWCAKLRPARQRKTSDVTSFWSASRCTEPARPLKWAVTVTGTNASITVMSVGGAVQGVQARLAPATAADGALGLDLDHAAFLAGGQAVDPQHALFARQCRRNAQQRGEQQGK
jgi:hypothetical protein